MTRQPYGKHEADVRSRTAPVTAERPSVDDSRPPVDETQTTRQSATAPQPKLGLDDSDEEITGEELDEAWAGLTLALRAADEDFDVAATYSRLSRSLPADLVQMPLVERAPPETERGVGTEFRNLALGLVAMGTVCAGLAGLAFFGPGFERRPRREQEVVGRTIDDPPRVSEASSGGSDVWSDSRWEEDLLALAQELEAERRRLSELAQARFLRPDEGFARLEHEFERTRREFGDGARF